MNSIVPKRAEIPRRTRSAAGFRGLTLGLGLMLALLLVGCGGRPMIPHPQVVYVPYPWEVKSSLSAEEIKEMYSASPDPNPEGLGHLDTVWGQSFITLEVWEYRRQIEEKNKLAYARTVTEQTIVLEAGESHYSRNVVFSGIVVGDFAELLQLDRYGPEGVYLMNDRGEKFLPTLAENLEPLIGAYRHPEAVEFEINEYGLTFWAFPHIEFPLEITPDTKWIRLYLAIFQKRMSFTWVFDPDYVPQGYRGRDIARRRQSWYAY
ncbi:MAG: hypothetical protein IIA41_08850 [SAR324 cluster bacterium]|nr:hypothetical protein [SAR324 cluster bacterium]